ncbi:BCCT family transporter [Haloarculaceae archaeon H-GB2-1]|nr:BCCT family transporter [Haloarculaceae archaeon H-GB1-1]MEA5387355.1 BCCT family transporter [Haloarculaceae archaeon H-GB11]MEA5408824.1 BCCT family transporter [Haloarculaceae archaeon H-GB2-1]
MADGDGSSEGMSDGLQVDLFHPDSDREPGDTNIEALGFDVHPIVFPISLVIIATFVAATIMLGEDASKFFTGIFDYINATFGWFYIIAVNVFIVTIVYFAVSKYGSIKIGGVQAEKEFSDFSWMAMLFSAGMGIGLMFFSVAEPMWHFASGGGTYFMAEGESLAAADAAMGVTFFHWGFHPWAIYGLVGLGLAFFSFNRGLPLTFRSIFWPLLGERIYGWPGHLIDLVTVFATLFGLASSLGFGVAQINAGVAEVTEILTGSAMVSTGSTTVQIGLIAIITGIATMSVAAGLDSGVKRLSTINLYLMFVFLAFLLIVGPTLFILDTFVGSIGTYFQNFLGMSFYTEAFAPTANMVDGWPYAGWQHAWTIFYWGWWIAWSPFVGMFIARISKGRTVREFVIGVLVLPSLFSFLWLATFGASALNISLNKGGGLVTTLFDQGQASAMFAMLQSYPLTAVTSVVATLLVVTFFVTSSDSGSLVIDHLTSGGKHDVPRVQRIFWAVTEGIVAAILLYGGGLGALQTAAITTGLPFAVILCLMCYTVYLGLDHEYDILASEEFRDRVSDLAGEEGVAVERSGSDVVTDVQDSSDASTSDD